MQSWTDKGMQQLLTDIDSEVRITRRWIGKDALDARVMQVMAQVPRHEFVPEGEQNLAYANGPLPIGHGQTISQPYIVALMTDLLAPQAEHTILEIGTGSGYQTAVLSLLCKTVYTMDLVPPLTKAASERLARLNYTNIHARSGNGYQGWPEHAPYDGIIVTAAASHIPEALVEQLKPGGRLVIPVGQPFMSQELMLVNKNEKGEIDTQDILAVAFVPLLNEDVATASAYIDE